MFGGCNKIEKKYKGEDVFLLADDIFEFSGGMHKLLEFITQQLSALDQKCYIGMRCHVSFLVTGTGDVVNLTIAREIIRMILPH